VEQAVTIREMLTEIGEPNGAMLVVLERQRQIAEEGYTAEHDAGVTCMNGQLAMAAACYAAPQPLFKEFRHETGTQFTDPWPWALKTDKRPREDGLALKTPTRDERIRLLVKAGALICAEIDRLQAQPAQIPIPATFRDDPSSADY
jgi:hypothetical protein